MIINYEGCYDDPREAPPSVIYCDDSYGYYDTLLDDRFYAPYGFIYYQGQAPYWESYYHRTFFGPSRRINVRLQLRSSTHAPVFRVDGERIMNDLDVANNKGERNE